jgi:hypothetical protein
VAHYRIPFAAEVHRIAVEAEEHHIEVVEAVHMAAGLEVDHTLVEDSLEEDTGLGVEDNDLVEGAVVAGSLHAEEDTEEADIDLVGDIDPVVEEGIDLEADIALVEEGTVVHILVVAEVLSRKANISSLQLVS